MTFVEDKYYTLNYFTKSEILYAKAISAFTQPQIDDFQRYLYLPSWSFSNCFLGMNISVQTASRALYYCYDESDSSLRTTYEIKNFDLVVSNKDCTHSINVDTIRPDFTIGAKEEARIEINDTEDVLRFDLSSYAKVVYNSQIIGSDIKRIEKVIVD